MAEDKDRPRKVGIAVTSVLLGGTLIAGALAGQAANARSLEPTATAALSSAGITGVDVTFKGREAYLAGAGGTQADLDAAKRVVESVRGVRWARITGGAAPAPTPTTATTTEPAPSTSATTPPTTASVSPSSTTQAPTNPFAVTIGPQGGIMSATGTIDNPNGLQDVLAQAGRVFGGGTVANRATAAPGATPPAWWGDLASRLAKFPMIEGGGMSATPTGITVTGSVADPAALQQLKDALQGAGFTVDNKVSLDPAVHVVSGPDGVTLSGTVASQADADALAAKVGAVFGQPVHSQLTVNPDCQGSPWFPALVTALGQAPAITGGSLDASAQGLSVSGSVATDADATALGTALGGVPLTLNNTVSSATAPATPATPLTPDEVAQINGTVVNFGASAYALDATAKQKLDAVLPLLAKSSATIEIKGYLSGNPAPDDPANSKQRAQAVADYLIAHGVAPARLTVTGMGTADPVASNATAAGRAANQRATLTVEGNN